MFVYTDLFFSLKCGHPIFLTNNVDPSRCLLQQCKYLLDFAVVLWEEVSVYH